MVSDFYEDPEVVVKTMEPMRFHGNEIVLFHVLDPQEIRPKIKDPALVLDMETGETMEVTPDYVRTEYAAQDRRPYRGIARAGTTFWHRLRLNRYEQAA